MHAEFYSELDVCMQEYGLDERCVETLRRISPDHGLEILRSIDHGVQNPSGYIVSMIKKCQGGDMPNDWRCPNRDCVNSRNIVFAKHHKCPKCGAPRRGRGGVAESVAGRSDDGELRDRLKVEPRPFIATVSDLGISIADRGWIIGDRGRNVHTIVDKLRAALEETGHVKKWPVMHFNENGDELEAEIRLFRPHDNHESFEFAERKLRGIIDEIKEKGPMEADTRHVFRPKRIQPDDWVCPNGQCGNLNFKKRDVCPLCGAPKPPKSELKVPEGVNVFTADRLTELPFGDVHVTWLVPHHLRGFVIGPGGVVLKEIEDDSGSTVILADPSEKKTVCGELFCECYIRGLPDCVRPAVAKICAIAGGRLGGDAILSLLTGVEEVLQADGNGLALKVIAGDFQVKEAMGKVRETMNAAGVTGLTLLEQYPEWFTIENKAQNAVVRISATWEKPSSTSWDDQTHPESWNESSRRGWASWS